MKLIAWSQETDTAILPERLPVDLEWARFPSGVKKQYSKPVAEESIQAIILDVTLDKYQCLVGDNVNYTIDFSESITVASIVPISVTDRQGRHITNIGCTITDGKAKGSFSMPVAGDFTVTNESINFHKISIGTELKIANDFWLRVYQ